MSESTTSIKTKTTPFSAKCFPNDQWVAHEADGEESIPENLAFLPLALYPCLGPTSADEFRHAAKITMHAAIKAQNPANSSTSNA